MYDRHPLRVLALAIALTVPALGGAGETSSSLVGEWRVIRGVVAPWAGETAGRPASEWVGRSLEFQANRVDGPTPFPCEDASYTPIEQPAEGLFEGGLPVPAARSAEALGVAPGDVAGVRVICSSGSFDFHRLDADSALFGLDNVVWTLVRAPGALAPAGAAEAVVQQFLEAHYAGEMAFLPDSVAAKRGFLSDALAQRIATYFAQPFPEDEPPPINGDPFTDSQDYPTRFVVGQATMASDGRAEVPVRLADAYVERRVIYVLAKAASGWRIDDLRYEREGRLSDDLAATPEG
jgi:hypothetical protein